MHDVLPSIAVLMPDDPRRYSPLFSPLQERRDYSADDCRFTLLFSADSGKAVVYDIRPDTDASTDTVPGGPARR
jgi:hypothetical protein